MNSKKAIAGLIGHGIQGSSSPQIHEAEAQAHGLDLVYRIIDFEAPKRDVSFLEPLLESAESIGFSGLNVTHPYKEEAYKLMDDLSNAAREIGSINTIVLKDGKRYGDNTDWSGFSDNLTATLPGISLNRVALLGTGGAGLAVAYALLRLGAKEVRLFDARQETASALQQHLQSLFADRTIVVAADAASAVEGADGLVNATPIGMEGHPGMPIAPAYLRPGLWVADIVWFPRETELLKEARKIGCKVCGGAGMAVRQAAASFAQFFNLEPNVERMLRNLVDG
ncbi:MAG: shikimate dehydrogenase [Edaphobacter sp.]|uniref:shikimate dehydrogenase n=1 Tax=Edaphobacter sp. TaxID=1934404 RepID=UPI0023831633|nr:shikimate dehydrogenase [Edaphobacter sp.]MDE1178295.1 shikimate dehydrogenase [Edaphobacter sp.]